MKIGIIVHSHTGNTLKVCEKVRSNLSERGLEAEILKVSPVDENEKKNFVLKEKPDTDPFDYIIFGAPVWAFSLSPIMKMYLEQIKSLKGKKVSCLVTQSGKPWMGGSRSVNKIAKLCESKGAKVEAKEIVCFKSEDLEKKIADAALKLSQTVKD
jgi:Flavodoxins